MPIDRRMSSGGMPAARCCSSLSWEWVVVAGWMASDLASPTLARCLKSLRESMNLRAGRGAALDAEDDHRAAFAAQIFAIERVLRIAGQAGIAHPLDRRVALQVFGGGQGVFAMAFHAQRQGFDALQGDPGIVGREAGAEVAQRAGAHAQDVGERRERGGQIVAPAQAVIGRVRLVKQRVLAGGPVEVPGVDHDAADARAVAAEPFGERVDDDVRAEPDRFG